MRKYIVYTSILLFVYAFAVRAASDSQKAYRRALLESLQTCGRIQSGHYDAVYHRRLPFLERTESVTGRCVFSKVAKDQVLGARISREGEEAGSKFTAAYDGRYEVVMTSAPNLVANVTDLSQCDAYFIAANSISGLLFAPLLPMLLFETKKETTLQHLISKRAVRIEKLPDDTVQGRPCSVFAAYCEDREEIKDEVLQLFIDHALNLPIKYIHQQSYWGSPTYTEAVISNLQFSCEENASCVPDARALIPEGYEIIEAHGRSRPQQALLPLGTTAPSWTLPTVQGGSLSLESLRGKVVLLSFWYKHCGASLQYLRSLQQLQEKFQNRGVVVVGINIYDQRGELAEFLQQRGIAYRNLLGNAQVTKDYHAYVPNTFYLLDRAGRVRYVTVIREDFPEKVLNWQIKQLLKCHRQMLSP